MQNTKIDSYVATFVAGLTDLVTEEALARVQAALGGAPAQAEKPAKKAKAAVAAEPVAKATKKTKHVAGAKRSPEDLAAVVEKVFGFIKANPGSGAETIGKNLGMKTAEFALPIKKLMADRRIRSKGAKRATVYSAK